MDNKTLASRLRFLARFDVDAAAAYQAAIDRVTDPAIKDKLNGLRLDHERHVQDYNEHITRLGGEPVELKPDLTGVVLRTLTALTSAVGTRAALVAMLGNEELSAGTYEVMLRLPWPPELQELIARNREEERQHLAWVLAAVKSPERARQSEPAGQGA